MRPGVGHVLLGAEADRLHHLARFDEDGFLFIEGRLSRFSKIGGEMVPHETVEAAINKVLGLDGESERRIAVVGVPDERWGERVTAVVQPREGRTPTAEELDAHCRTEIAAYKAPKQVFLVDQISRAPSGKPDYPWAKDYAKAAALKG